MHDKLAKTLICLSLLGVFSLVARAETRKPILGDFAAEIRKADGHIDVAANIAALKTLGANTYFYLTWHAQTDWEDLPEFATAAEREGIDVWVYVIPWSETPLVKKSWGYSEPFKTDYVRWAEEIARLSLKHSNIVGYVIDDFYTNSTQPDRFSPAYVKKMVKAGREINPRIKFYPLVYFQQPWTDFMERFGGLVDGVVAAYPKSRLQIGNALAYLNDEAHGASMIAEFPRGKSSEPGDKGAIWTDVKVSDAEKATISFYWDDDDRTDNKGYHTAFVRVDGRLVWQVDTAGDHGDHVVELDLSRIVKNGDTVRIELGAIDTKSVARYPVTVKIDDIRMTGFELPKNGPDSDLASERLWNRKATGAYKVNLLPASKAQGRFHLPMIVMPAGEREQHEKRYNESGTPRNIAYKTEMAVNLMREGRVEGVVTYCLPKGPADEIFDAVRFEYQRANDAINRRTPN